MLYDLLHMFLIGDQSASLAIWPLILAALGAVKGMTVDKGNEDRARRLAAETARYSPWTGLNSQNVPIKNADPLGNAVQGGLAGLSFSQGMDKGGSNTAASSPSTSSSSGSGPSLLSSEQMNLLNFMTPEAKARFARLNGIYNPSNSG